ncbi:hypothetical protein [Chiayiivirga flava]|uniref:Poly(3-hydroxybutyrate) depolymerase n=1 Tax=Chiayiivirga flava TaxID=659595 RepID=A0A7W8D4U3_9GAMM|nr:hypothetical protein [Chiayiivirga flava]MBB5206820.1 poly(3-hydroxybutyrate) depolymerase [Chiayiivirga flava]
MRTAGWSTMLAVLLLAGCGDDAAPPLQALTLDPTRVAVAGISSGATMAQQVHLAYSDRIGGAALVAGSPAGCAENSLDFALSRCIKGAPQGPSAPALAARARALADAGRIAPLEGLAGDRVLVTRGASDALVAAAVTRAAHDLYPALEHAAGQSFSPAMTLAFVEGSFAHVWPTRDAGGDCGTTAAPYIGRCGLDLAGDIVAALFVTPPVAAPDQARGAPTPFDQNAFLPGGADAFLADTGLVYIPSQCGEPGRCGLLIAFQGCEQDIGSIGDLFARESGFNRWADVADLVVLYPQTRATYMPLNPKACWDWWGYSGAEYDTRDGLQLRWLANAAARLGVRLL